jgi:aerobic-type carbon monoxide dehydrogenase small subunit (CoxS/CutS family)
MRGDEGHTIDFTVDGRTVRAPAGGSLLDALRDHAGVRSAKDGCSPQGQCGCCTVWVDGQPRVACVTPVTRVAGRAVTTLDGLPDADDWARRFCAAGASQCGFCTPGIIMRLAALVPERRTTDQVRQALLAHLCRCTGWTTIVDAATAPDVGVLPAPELGARRAALEGHTPQRIGPDVALGRGGFAADTVPDGALVALRDEQGAWVVAGTIAEARRRAARVQGRRTTLPVSWPVEVPAGDWAITLQTTWTEPAYLEPDASWCEPGGEPASPLGNGGAFGGKVTSPVALAARELADRYGRPVLAMLTRDDVVRLGPKRPPLAMGLRGDGSGIVRVARTPGITDRIRAATPDVRVDEVDVPGPITSAAVRGAGWAEVTVCRAVLTGDDSVTSPDGATARAIVHADNHVELWVRCGDPLDRTVLHSYCVGAAHMALGWVRSEAIVLDADGVPVDVTLRSAGVLRAVDTPAITVHIADDDGPPVNGSDAVFAAVAAAEWRHRDRPPRWPTMRT